jgi:hypothetical protein
VAFKKLIVSLRGCQNRLVAPTIRYYTRYGSAVRYSFDLKTRITVLSAAIQSVCTSVSPPNGLSRKCYPCSGPRTTAGNRTQNTMPDDTQTTPQSGVAEYDRFERLEDAESD